MAHTKAKGTTKLGRDSESKRLGVKIFGGSPVKCGQIIIRQRGTRYMAGEGTKIGKDDTIYAVRNGVVAFKKIRYTNFTGNKQMKTFVSVASATETKLKVKSEKLALSPRAPRDNRTKSVSPEAMVTGVKKAENEVNSNPEKFNPREAEETMKRKTQGQIIREEELPRIPMRKDLKKVKSPVKHSHKKS